MRLDSWVAPGLLFAGLTMYGQQPAPRVALNVVALDSAGNPVTDLAASDFTVIDNGSRQQIVSVHLNQADGPRPVVILFDLLNSNMDSRGAACSHPCGWEHVGRRPVTAGNWLAFSAVGNSNLHG
jgi:hypothetical protein